MTRRRERATLAIDSSFDYFQIRRCLSIAAACHYLRCARRATSFMPLMR